MVTVVYLMFRFKFCLSFACFESLGWTTLFSFLQHNVVALDNAIVALVCQRKGERGETNVYFMNFPYLD